MMNSKKYTQNSRDLKTHTHTHTHTHTLTHIHTHTHTHTHTHAIYEGNFKPFCCCNFMQNVRNIICHASIRQ